MNAANRAIAVRPMRRRDIREVRRLDEAAYGDAWTRETWLAELDRADRHHLVAEEEGTLVGHGGLMLVLADAHVTTVAVAPSARRRGIARRLVTELLVAARNAAASAATLEVRVSNEAAIALYRCFGFAPVGTRRRYYPAPGGGREDALVMWLTDLDGDAVAERLGGAEHMVAPAGTGGGI